MQAIETIDISNLSVREKLGLMELLWRDLSREPENLEVPQWHLDRLKEAERSVAEGTDEFIDLDVFKAELRDVINQRKRV